VVTGPRWRLGAADVTALWRRAVELDSASKVTGDRSSTTHIVASANPGCTLHLAAAGVAVRHPIELIDEALHG